MDETLFLKSSPIARPLNTGKTFTHQLTSARALDRGEIFAIGEEISQKFSPKPPAFAPYIQPKKTSYLNRSSLSGYTHYAQSIKLSPQELVEISQDISRQFAPDYCAKTPELVLLPVDPYHLYAYWQVADQDLDIKANSIPKSNNVMRVYWVPDENRDVSHSKMWFDVNLETEKSAKKIRLPISGTAYSAVIGQFSSSHDFNVITQSNVIHVPSGGPTMESETLPSTDLSPAKKIIVGNESDKSMLHDYSESNNHACPNPKSPFFAMDKNDLSSSSKICANSDNGYEAIFFAKMAEMLSDSGIRITSMPPDKLTKNFADALNNASGFGK